MKPRSDPNSHQRRSLRLRDYDYRQAGIYFLTLCTHQRELLFHDPDLRRVAEALWQRIPLHFPRVQLDAFVVMPNHVHGIIDITGGGSLGDAFPDATLPAIPVAPAGTGSKMQPVAGNASPLQERPRGSAPGSLSAVVGNYKSVTARRINRLRRTPGAPVWQRNYYEHVVRNERALNAIRAYILDNPARWEWDSYNPGAAGPDPDARALLRILQEG